MLLAVGPLVAVLDLAAAHARGDLDEVGRLAMLQGASGIEPLLTAPDPSGVAVGIAAAPSAPDGWELLDELAALAGSWDRSAAAPAAHAAVRIARAIDAEVVIRFDVPDDVLATQEQAWRALAMRNDRWADVRVHALETAAQLARARLATAEQPSGVDLQLSGVGFGLVEVLAEGDPELRRAGCELVPQPTPAGLLSGLGAAVRDDESPAVAVACAQALCADLAFDPAGPAMAALGDAGAARLRTLLGDRRGPPAVPAGALVDAARCLAAHGTREDRAALAALALHAPKQIRPMLRHIR